MRLAGVAIIVLAVVPLLAGIIWPAAGQTPLGADMNNIFWLSDIATPKIPIELKGSYSAGAWNWVRRDIILYYDTTDLPQWAVNGDVYYVVCYGFRDVPSGWTYIELRITNGKLLWPGVKVYADQPTSSAVKPTACVTSLAAVSGEHLTDGAIKIEIAGPTPKADDPNVAIQLMKIGIAPPEGAASDADNGGGGKAALSDMYVLSGREMAMLALGFGALALALTIILFAGKRR